MTGFSRGLGTTGIDGLSPSWRSPGRRRAGSHEGVSGQVPVNFCPVKMADTMKVMLAAGCYERFAFGYDLVLDKLNDDAKHKLEKVRFSQLTR